MGVSMIIKLDLKKFLISLLIPLAVGGISGFITRNAMNIYEQIKSPPLAPPSWVFPVVWSILYVLMGVSLYLIWNSGAAYQDKRRAIILFALQLAFNFIWSPIFFISKNFFASFAVLVIIWIFTLLMIISFYRISKPAGLLQIPYLIWLTFAGYLNFAIYLLN